MDGAASAALTLCRASLRYGGERVSVRGGKEEQESIGKSAGGWHFTLGER